MRLALTVLVPFCFLSLAGCGQNATQQVSDENTVSAHDNASAAEEPRTDDATAAASDEAEAASTPEATAAEEQYNLLLAEYEAEGGARIFAKRFLELAEKHPQDPVAVDALLWVVSNVRGKPDTTRALELLTEQHITSDQLRSAGKGIAESRSIAAEKLLNTILQKNPDDQARAQALYFLASLLELEANLVQQLKAQPELAPRVLQYYGKPYGNHLASLELPDLERKREQIYEQMRETFPDAEVDRIKLGDFAEKMLFRIRHLSIGKLAPDIAGEDIAGNEFKLSDHRGKVVLLTFWGHW